MYPFIFCLHYFVLEHFAYSKNKGIPKLLCFSPIPLTFKRNWIDCFIGAFDSHSTLPLQLNFHWSIKRFQFGRRETIRQEVTWLKIFSRSLDWFIISSWLPCFRHSPVVGNMAWGFILQFWVCFTSTSSIYDLGLLLLYFFLHANTYLIDDHKL